MTRSSHDADAAADAAAAAATTAGPAIKTQSGASKGSLIDPGHGYPHGHLGHLTADEEKALAAFKAHLAEQGLYTPSSAEEETKKEKKTKTKTKTPPSHDDTVLLRFLRARRWVVADATKQFKDTETWRAAIQIDVLYDTIDVDAYETSRQLYPQWTGRRDRRGIPVYVFEIRHLDTKTIAAYEKSVANTYSKAHVSASSSSSSKAATTPPKLVRLFALYENLTRFAQPLCTQLTDRPFETTPITLSTNIVDVSGVSLKGFWNLKGHMQAASQLATAHYPETLDRIFVIGAPIFFSTVWGWIKRWFDPVTVSKIFILAPAEVFPTLSSFIDIENIPKQYGGKLDFSWGDSPNLDPKIKALAQWEGGSQEFPKGPLYWVPIDGGKRMECLARGSVDKKERNDKVCSIPVAFFDDDELDDNDDDDKDEEDEEDVPAANGKPVDTEVTSPVAETFVDAPEEPLASPVAAAAEAPAQGIQNLSLRDADEKAGAGDVEVTEKTGEADAIPNGKPVVAS